MDNTTISAYPIVVDYSLTLEQMIQQGNYSEVHPDITVEHFPLPKNTKREKENVNIILVHFNIEANAYRVEDLLKQRGYRFADIREFLAFGASPSIQIGFPFPIVTFGSILRDAYGGCGIPCLSGELDNRCLSLLMEWRLIGEELCKWNRSFRFAAIAET